MKPFRLRIRHLLLLAWLQRAVRLFLRAAWLMVGGYLIALGSNQLWGWLPDSRTWLLAGGVPGLLALLAVFFPWPRTARLAWRLDRTYGLQEQVSTAWEVSHHEPVKPLELLLIEDAAVLLPPIIRRVWWRGWNLLSDVVSFIIVIALAAIMLGADWAITPLSPFEVEAARLPAPEQDPQAEDVFPSGIPGVEVPAAANNSKEAGEGQGLAARSAAADAALRDLGDALSQQPASFDAGQSLQQGDLQGAADELEFLADHLDDLSRETQEELASAFEESGQDIAEDGFPEEQQLAGDMQQLADQIRETADLTAREQMDEVAQDLRELSEAVLETESDNAVAGAGPPTAGGPDERAGDPQPFERIRGEGETISLGSENDSSGLLRPGSYREAGTAVAGGAYDYQASNNSAVVSDILTPYQYPWILRHVVSEYFTPR